MSRLPKSPDLVVKEAQAKVENPQQEIPEELQKRFDHWLAILKRQFPMKSKRELERLAAEYACMNRKQLRRVFKHSSPKLPRLMKVPKG